MDSIEEIAEELRLHPQHVRFILSQYFYNVHILLGRKECINFFAKPLGRFTFDNKRYMNRGINNMISKTDHQVYPDLDTRIISLYTYAYNEYLPKVLGEHLVGKRTEEGKQALIEWLQNDQDALTRHIIKKEKQQIYEQRAKQFFDKEIKELEQIKN